MSRVVERPDNRRPELLAVAARLFAKGGFEATSMRDIAGEVKPLEDLPLKRTQTALAHLTQPKSFDVGAGESRLAELLDIAA